MDIEERTETTIIALLNDRLDYWKGELEMLIEYFQGFSLLLTLKNFVILKRAKQKAIRKWQT